MTDYTEMCRRLRALAEGCSRLSQQGYDLLNNAADAIERLADENTRLVTTANELSKMYAKLVDEMPDGWIPVTERLPEKDKGALFYTEWTGQSGTIYQEMQLTTLAELTYHGYRPIAWMPLPEPPEQSKEGNY